MRIARFQHRHHARVQAKVECVWVRERWIEYAAAVIDSQVCLKISQSGIALMPSPAGAPFKPTLSRFGEIYVLHKA